MVFRVNKCADYTVMSNAHLREKEMSLKAKGLLSIMLSLPDDWDYSINGLCTLSKDGYEGVMTALKELEKYGYLVRTRATDDRGHFVGYDYDIFERPKTENPSTGKPETENPKSAFPITENPSTGKPGQINTDEPNTDLPSTKEPSMEEQNTAQARKSKGVLNKTEQELFDRFWEAYPRKVAKANAEKAWKKIGATPEITTLILIGISTAMKMDFRFRDAQYIPHPATWLNGREWENTYDEGRAKNAGGNFKPSTGFRTDF